MEEAPIDARVCFCGMTSVGKTCIITRATTGTFEEVQQTVGACYATKTIVVGSTTVNLQIWDTAGQDRFRTLAPMYYRGSVVCVLVYAINNLESFHDIKSWQAEIKERTDPMPHLFLVANKIDLRERCVSAQDGERRASELQASFCEVSAKEGRGIEELFQRVAEVALRRARRQDAPSVTPAVTLREEDSKQKKKGGGGC